MRDVEKALGVTEARAKLRSIVEHVQRGDAYIISRHGQPAAAIVPIEVYEQWKQQRREFFALIREAQQRADLEPDEAERIAAEAVRAARA
jgi:prevent-host-death family protein